MITLLLLVHTTYMYGVVLHAHPVRGESHIQRNTTEEVATQPTKTSLYKFQQRLTKEQFLIQEPLFGQM